MYYCEGTETHWISLLRTFCSDPIKHIHLNVKKVFTSSDFFFLGRSWFPRLPRSTGESICFFPSAAEEEGGARWSPGSSVPCSCVCVQGEDGLEGTKGYPGPKGNQGRGVSDNVPSISLLKVLLFFRDHLSLLWWIQGNSGGSGTSGDPGDQGHPGYRVGLWFYSAEIWELWAGRLHYDMRILTPPPPSGSQRPSWRQRHDCKSNMEHFTVLYYFHTFTSEMFWMQDFNL